MRKRITSLLLICLLCLMAVTSFGYIRVYAEEKAMDYTETADTFLNPERGFYKALSAKLSADGGTLFSESDDIEKYAQDYGILHLRIGLEAFSANAGGQNIDITEEAKQSLKNALQLLQSYQAGAIIRFSYNVNGEVDQFGEYLEAEPPLNNVLEHIQSLGEVISSFPNVILGVESGMLGPWGEQHSTILGSASASNASTYHKVVQTWLDSTPEEIGITVRRPLYFRYWANIQFGLDLELSDLQFFDFTKYPLASRVGVYNDGYLGSATDLGTFSKNNRDAEVAFLSIVGENTFYGGEVVADDDTGGIGEYNSCDFIEKEGFITHTSYLNIAWNYNNVIRVWQNTAYSGKDALYQEKTQFDYINNHLGYRFVLKSSEFSLTNKTLDGQFTLSNVGFGNLIRKANCQILVSNGTQAYTMATEVDLRKVKSGAEEQFSVSLPVNFPLTEGEWSVRLQVTSCSGKPIRFANKASNFTEEGNLLGYFSVDEQVVATQSFLVTFDGNGGKLIDGTTSQIVYYGKSATAPVFEREGYRFVGWNKSFDNVTENIHIIAVWELITGEEISSENSSSVPDKEENDDTLNSGNISEEKEDLPSCSSAVSMIPLLPILLSAFLLLKKQKQ